MTSVNCQSRAERAAETHNRRGQEHIEGETGQKQRRGERERELNNKWIESSAGGSCHCQTRNLVPPKTSAGIIISLLCGTNYPLPHVHTKHSKALDSHMHTPRHLACMYVIARARVLKKVDRENAGGEKSHEEIKSD